ncbi:MAG: hypothetical protein Q4E88_02135 [Coriobacteriia bacterium]|nr:hypothetical protein [Coriobacteriia bacterium]
MKNTLATIIGAIFDYFFQLFHLIGDCFHLRWTPENRNENILNLLRAALVVLPIIVCIICCCTYYANHPFVPTGNSMFGFDAIEKFYVINLITVVMLLIACVIFLFLVRRSPDFMLVLRLLLFSFIFLPIIIFCVTNLYMLIALVIIVVLIIILGKLILNRDRVVPKRKREKPAQKTREEHTSEPPELNGKPYTSNQAGTKFRVKNMHRVKIYVGQEGEMMVATNTFGEPSVDLGPERDFRSGKLSLFDEENNQINPRQIRHIK